MATISFASIALGAVLGAVLAYVFFANRRAPNIGADGNADDRQLRNVIDHSNQGYMIHRNFKALYVNDEFVRLYGYKSAQEIYDLESTQDLIAPDWRAPERHLEILDRTTPDDEIDYLALRKDGSTFWVNRRSFPIDWNGEPAVCSARRDVSERVADQQKLADAVVAAERANQAKTDFLSRMSHELRTPLNAIIGFTDLMNDDADDPLSPNQRHAVQHISQAGTHLLGLVNDVLQISDMDADKVTMAIEPVRISSIFGDCLRPVDTLIERTGVILEIEPESRRFVRADHLRLRQAALNLVINAIKYNREGGKVYLHTSEQPDGLVRINVTDTGHGIPEQERDKLFEPFDRADADQSNTDGMGIGLPVAKQLVEAMAGKIGFDSEEGQGSTFWIELPGAEDPHSALTDTALPDMPSDESLQGYVLYVDDNPTNLELMEMILETSPGIRLETATNGEMGIAAAREDPPDLFLLDINLPGISGIEALTQLQEYPETKGIPAVAISAAATPSDVEKGLMAGFDMYLTKPLDIEEVRHTVAAFLRAKEEMHVS